MEIRAKLSPQEVYPTNGHINPDTVDRRQASIFHFFMTMPPRSIYLPAVPAGTLLACLYFLLIVIFFFLNNDDVLQLGLMVLISSYLILLENLVIWDRAH